MTEYSVRKLQKTTSTAKYRGYPLSEFNYMIIMKYILSVLICTYALCTWSLKYNSSNYIKTENFMQKQISIEDTITINIIDQMIIGSWVENTEQDDDLNRKWVFTEQGTLREYE